MNGEYFVMLWTEDGYVPLMKSAYIIERFDSEEKACKAAESQIIRSHNGYKVFSMYFDGEDYFGSSNAEFTTSRELVDLVSMSSEYTK